MIEKEHILEQLYDFFLENTCIVAVYLFGSYAKGKAKTYGDVDVAVLLDESVPAPYFNLRLEYQLKLETLFREKVDVVILNDASPLLKQQVFYYGIKVNCRDHDKLVAFRVKSYYEQFDYLRLNQKFFEIKKAKILGGV